MQINNENVDEILSSKKVVILNFKAAWCGPCRMISPIIDILHNEYLESNPDDVFIGKIDIDEATELTLKYGVRSVPTLIFIKNGEVVETVVGAIPKSKIQETIKTLLDDASE